MQLFFFCFNIFRTHWRSVCVRVWLCGFQFAVLAVKRWHVVWHSVDSRVTSPQNYFEVSLSIRIAPYIPSKFLGCTEQIRLSNFFSRVNKCRWTNLIWFLFCFDSFIHTYTWTFFCWTSLSIKVTQSLLFRYIEYWCNQMTITRNRFWESQTLERFSLRFLSNLTG